MSFINRNIDNASELKFWPNIIFSSVVEKYINDLAGFYSVHPDSFAIVLMNSVAATLEFSFVLRANSPKNPIPTNLYDMIIARSSYGKSELTKILRDVLKTVVTHRPNKFRSLDPILTGPSVNPTIDEMSKAGLMSGLNECCRTVVSDEADMTFSDVGLFWSHIPGRTSAEMNCRVLMMTLFDRTSHAYIRQLANRAVSVQRSKLNILGCSTGELIANIIIRMKTGCCYDPAIGRFLFWPLDGPVIPDTIVQKEIDYSLMASLNQFIIVLSFIENTFFTFEEDALQEIVSWGNSCKQKSFDTRNTNECLAARVGKTIQHAYRVVCFLQTIEIGFYICQKYLNEQKQFPAEGIVNDAFITKIENLYHLNFPDKFALHDNQPFFISKDVTSRAINLMSCNMRQFILLFDDSNAPKISSIGRQIVVVSSNQHQGGSTIESTVLNSQLKEKKQHQRRMLNFHSVATAVLLFPSICFTMKQLHQSTTIHNNSGGGLLKEVLNKLVASDALVLCPRGIKHTSRSTSLYIKRIPFANDDEAEKEFLLILSEYSSSNKAITIDMYRESCEFIILDAIGEVQEDVYEVLRRPEYGNRDLSMLALLPKTAVPKSNLSTISIGNNEEDSVFNTDIDPNLYLSFEQELGHRITVQNNHQLLGDGGGQERENATNSSNDSIISKTGKENMCVDNIENTQACDQIVVEDSIGTVNGNQYQTSENEKENQVSNMVPSTTINNDEFATGFICGDSGENLNDGFVSPTAWQTRSRSKDNKIEKHNNQLASENSSTMLIECVENSNSLTISPSPPSRRTRAQLKRKGTNHVDQRKRK